MEKIFGCKGSKPSLTQVNTSTPHTIILPNNQIESLNLVLNLNLPISHDDTQSNASLHGAIIAQMPRASNVQQMEGTLVRDPNPPHRPISSLNLHFIDLETESSNEYANNVFNNRVIPIDNPSDGSSNEMRLNLPRYDASIIRRGPFVCRQCNTEFATSHGIGAHQNMHRQERQRRRRARNNFVATPPSNIPPFNNPSNIPPSNYYPSNVSARNSASAYACYCSNPSRPTNMAYNPTFDGPIGCRTGTIIQRPSPIGGSSSSYNNFHHNNNVTANNNSYLMNPPMTQFNRMLNEAIHHQYQNALWGYDLSLGGIFANTSTTNNGASSSTNNNINEGNGEGLVQREEDDQGKDELDLTLKL